MLFSFSAVVERNPAIKCTKKDIEVTLGNYFTNSRDHGADSRKKSSVAGNEQNTAENDT